MKKQNNFSCGDRGHQRLPQPRGRGTPGAPLLRRARQQVQAGVARLPLRRAHPGGGGPLGQDRQGVDQLRHQWVCLLIFS